MTDLKAMEQILERGYSMTIAEEDGFMRIMTSNARTCIRTVAKMPPKGNEMQSILSFILNDQKTN